MNAGWRSVSGEVDVAASGSGNARIVAETSTPFASGPVRLANRIILDTKGLADHARSMIGSTLGSYRVLDTLGEGGMGQVLRAHDTKLNREVALKVLPDSFASDPDRLARFEREAQVLAALNHQNIAHLYGVEESGAKRALVMELVSGQTLADRIKAGPIPLPDVLSIARQIAEALEAAHEQGIVHRDLKPANVKVRDDGVVKVLDFGLAKAYEPAALPGDPINSPTFTANATQAGMILGTAAYMSPEQAKGKTVDKRSDIWAFGVVLYEMLAARSLFSNDNVTETLAQVILKDPDWSSLPPSTPPALRRLLARCLVRDPRNRLRDIGDARVALQEVEDKPEAETSGGRARTPSGWRERAIGVIALLGVLATTGLLIRSWLQPAPKLERVRFEVLPGPDAATWVRWLELSPDGRHLAFSTSVPTRGLFLRSLDSPDIRLIGGNEVFTSTSAPLFFFWSADSQFIAYFADGKLKKLPVTGGPAQVICELPPALSYTGTWNTDGVILFGAATREGTRIWRVSATGGQPAPLHETSGSEPPQEFFPSFLPDGRHYLALTPTGNGQSAQAFVGDLDSNSRQLLPGVTTPPRYSSAGYLAFKREGSLMAQPFDASRRQLSGEPTVITENLFDAVGQFSVSATGALAFRLSGESRDSPLMRFDRTGNLIRTESLTGTLQAPSLPRDGKRLAIERAEGSGIDVWVIDLVRGTNTRLTDDPLPDTRPVFSPDGERVAFTRSDVIYLKSSSGTGTEERLIEGETTDWSPDGKVISFIRDADLWAVRLDGDRTPVRIAQTKGNDRRGRFSPDGKWIAYESDFSGRFEVYVQRFPPTAERVQVSVDGGGSAYWRSNGKELYFSASDRTIMAVDVTLGSTFQAGTPRRLFDVPGLINNRRFVVTPDGQQLLVPVLKADPLPITVILDWAAGLRK